MGLLGDIRQTFRRTKKWGRWAFMDMPRSPKFEIYARKQDAINRAYVNLVRSSGDPALSPPARPVPKIIWMFWSQGETEAPAIVKHCINSWRTLNPTWDIRILDQTSAREIIDLSDLPSFLPRRFEANLLRVRLMAKYGGVWTDATTYCHRPLEDWLPDMAPNGFFVFTNPGPDRWFANWFIASAPDHPLTTAWAEFYGGYLRQCASQPAPYFILSYALQFVINQAPTLQDAWRVCSGLPAMPTFQLQAALKGDATAAKAVRNSLEHGLTVSKLNWKDPVNLDALEAFLAHNRLV